MRSIDILDPSQNKLTNESLITLDFSESAVIENVNKLTNIIPTNLPMLCKPNK
jgi:hypothetical protein